MNSTGQLSEEDAFHNSYYYFVEAVKVLSLPAENQCETMGDYNVAWELKDDVQAGSYLTGKGYLEPNQEAWIQTLVRALNAVPVQELSSGAGREANLSAMIHPSWVPLRIMATQVLQELQPYTEINTKYFGSNSDAT